MANNVELHIETLRLSGLPATLDYTSTLDAAQAELVRLFSDGPVPAVEWAAGVVAITTPESWPSTPHSTGVAIANAIYRGITERGT